MDVINPCGLAYFCKQELAYVTITLHTSYISRMSVLLTSSF